MLKEHYLVYDGYSLFVDMGGLVGIFLGLSVVAAFDFIFDLITAIAFRILAFWERKAVINHAPISHFMFKWNHFF